MMKRSKPIKRTAIKKRRPKAGVNLKTGRIRLSAAAMVQLRDEVWDRSNGYCENAFATHIHGKIRRCLSPPSELHHIIYRSHGGSDSLDNCVALCKRCHESIHAGVWKFQYWRAYAQ